MYLYVLGVQSVSLPQTFVTYFFLSIDVHLAVTSHSCSVVHAIDTVSSSFSESLLALAFCAYYEQYLLLKKVQSKEACEMYL